MMSLEEKIIDYMARRRVALTPKHAKYLIRLILEEKDPDGECLVVKSQYSAMTDSYGAIRRTNVPVTLAMKVIEKHTQANTHKFYKYEIYAPSGLMLKEIYTINSDLI